MTYDQTIDYLFSRLPLFSRIGQAAYKADLTNTIILCDAIGNPQNEIKTIHIAGTNGKGSTSHMLAAILQQCGYRTGLYTSPHLKDFRERIKVNGEMIAKDFITDFVEKIRTVSEKIEPSFFEMTVAMAFDYFKAEKVDVAIIETGLGGRLDSTNIITPELSVITNIGYDHMNILGDTLEKIAYEKAGIIKENVPVVVGETRPATKEIFLSQAKKLKANISFAEENYEINKLKFNVHNLYLEVLNVSKNEVNNFTLDLNGIYQQKNIKTVLSSIDELRIKGFFIDDKNIKLALNNVKKLTGLYGRWDVINSKPLVVLDVAHNEDGIKQLAQQLSFYEYRNLHIILGIVKDKDASKILSVLPKNASYYFTKAQIPRALPEDELASKASAYQLKGDVFQEVNLALKVALEKAFEDDLILICGSVFVVGEVEINSFFKKDQLSSFNLNKA